MFYRKSPEEQQADLDRPMTPEEVQYSAEPTCFEVHEKWKLPCDQSGCRNFIKFEEVNSNDYRCFKLNFGRSIKKNNYGK